METIQAIIKNDIEKVKKFVNSGNVNAVLDEKSKYTAVHYAIEIKKRSKILSYFIKLGISLYSQKSSGINIIIFAEKC